MTITSKASTRKDCWWACRQPWRMNSVFCPAASSPMANPSVMIITPSTCSNSTAKTCGPCRIGCGSCDWRTCCCRVRSTRMSDWSRPLSRPGRRPNCGSGCGGGAAEASGSNHRRRPTLKAVVARINARRSVEIGLFQGRSLVSCGNVAIPANHQIPRVGAIVEVRYLHAFKESGVLYQPVYLGPRDDVDPGECLVSQLKFKAE